LRHNESTLRHTVQKLPYGLEEKLACNQVTHVTGSVWGCAVRLAVSF